MDKEVVSDMARFFDPKCTQNLLPKVTNLTAHWFLPLSS